ncbi:hypothetical protein BKA70DRAFT_1401102 [Coprinopsis sp. MPI-PUGE-AT-0042]|nr:hypothetical protein BKA70DRAFT_1401102 [Coprinopsis sp. MPI-PUGE-AT-0042]
MVTKQPGVVDRPGAIGDFDMTVFSCMTGISRKSSVDSLTYFNTDPLGHSGLCQVHLCQLPQKRLYCSGVQDVWGESEEANDQPPVVVHTFQPPCLLETSLTNSQMGNVKKEEEVQDHERLGEEQAQAARCALLGSTLTPLFISTSRTQTTRLTFDHPPQEQRLRTKKREGKLKSRWEYKGNFIRPVHVSSILESLQTNRNPRTNLALDNIAERITLHHLALFLSVQDNGGNSSSRKQKGLFLATRIFIIIQIRHDHSSAIQTTFCIYPTFDHQSIAFRGSQPSLSSTSAILHIRDFGKDDPSKLRERDHLTLIRFYAPPGRTHRVRAQPQCLTLLVPERMLDSGERAKGPAVLGTVEETHRSSVGTTFRVGVKTVEKSPLLSHQRRVVASTRTGSNTFEGRLDGTNGEGIKGNFDMHSASRRSLNTAYESTSLASRPRLPRQIHHRQRSRRSTTHHPQLKSPSSEGWKERSASLNNR